MPTLKLTEKDLAKPWLGANDQVDIHDEELPGFLVTIGRRSKTFFVDYRAGDKRRRVRIGKHGVMMPADPRDALQTPQPWNILRARAKARELLGRVAAGDDPAAPAPVLKAGPTLRDAVDLHVDNLRKGKKSIHSIEVYTKGFVTHMADWLDRPIAELTGLELNKIHRAMRDKGQAKYDKLIKDGETRLPTANEPGIVLANRIVRQAKAVWNTLDRLVQLEGRNPARGIVPFDEVPKQSRIDDLDFPSWYGKVQKLAAVRRDLQMTALHTGARDGSVCRVRWDDIDFEARLLTFKFAKGGKPYTVPMGRRLCKRLKQRKEANAVEFAKHGGDHGFVFPSLSRSKGADGKHRVIAVAESKEYAVVNGVKVRHLPPVHDLRRTYNSVALDIGIPEEQRCRLMNHAIQGVNAKHYSVSQDGGHLAECQQRIEDALWQRISPRPVPEPVLDSGGVVDDPSLA